MSFKIVKSFSYTNLNKNSISLFDLFLNKINIEENIQYKLNIIKINEIKFINLYSLSLNENIYKISSLKHPKKALSINLEAGSYKIILKSFGLYNKNTNNFNDCIKSSKGMVTLSNFEFIDEENKFDENENINYSNLKNKLINEFEFKMNKAGVFSIWIETNDINSLIGNFEFYIIKIDEAKINEEINSFLFVKNTYADLSFTLKNNSIYLFEIYQLVNDELNYVPKYKYPEGTYQVILNTELISTKNKELIDLTKNNDKHKYSLSFGKLKNLNNIIIPYNLNPINYYYMIGKVEFLLYFDFITDTYYFQPISFAECFMALYIPKTYFKLIEQNENNTYSIFKVIYYTLIYHNFNNKLEIKNNIKKWLSVSDDKINVDEYELYYWVDLQNVGTYIYNSNIGNEFQLYENIINQITEIEQFYTYINISIEGEIYDDVSLQISENDNLDWNVNNATFIILSEKPNKINYINWELKSDWKNKDYIQNLLYSNIFGEGTIKITKQHFKNATGIDIDNPNFNQDNNYLTKEQLLKLNINEPQLAPYNRFQYWLRSDKF